MFFCETEVNVSWKWPTVELEHHILEKFKFSVVDPNVVKFGEQGMFADMTMEIDNLFLTLKASGRWSKMTVEDGNFNWVASLKNAAYLVAATCDRF